MIGTFHLAQATDLLTILKRRIRHNADQLNGLQDTFKHMTNSFEQDPFRMAIKPPLKQDLDIGIIDTVPTTQLISNILPKEGIYKTIVSHKEFELISSKSFYFNPRSGTLDGGVPMDGVSPTIIQNHSIMTEYFNRMGFTPMSEDLISSHGIMWKALNHAVESLINGFKIEFGALEEAAGGLMSYDATDCVLHIVISQTPDSISLVYGNLFSIVKIGCSFRKVWYNYNTWDARSDFCNGCPIPDGLSEFTNALWHKEKIHGYHIVVDLEEGLRNALGTYTSSDILERVGAMALGLKGIVPAPLGVLI